MKCPNWNETLLMTERNQIEIDYCPACRGVWLDKGELDKMLEYTAQIFPPEQRENQYGFPTDTYRHQHDKYPPNHHKPYKRNISLGDLFDFD